MRLTVAAAAIALWGPSASLAAPADAAAEEEGARRLRARGSTVYVSRDENGRKRTRIIIQKRSYLDPGTETFPGERGDHDYASLPGQRADQRARQHHVRRQPDGAAGPVHAAVQE